MSEYRRAAKKVDTFVHTWNRVRVLNRHYVQIAVLDGNARSSVLHRNKTMCEAHSVRRAKKHPWWSFDFFPAFWLLQLRLWTIWDGVNWSGIHHFPFDSVLHAVIEPRCPSQVLRNCVITIVNMLLCEHYSFAVVRYFTQSVLKFFLDCYTVFCSSICSLGFSGGIYHAAFTVGSELSLSYCVGIRPFFDNMCDFFSLSHVWYMSGHLMQVELSWISES